MTPLENAQRPRMETTINDLININCQIDALEVSAFTAVSCMEKPNAASIANNMACLVLFIGGNSQIKTGPNPDWRWAGVLTSKNVEIKKFPTDHARK
jgi:hypothetical protein